MIVTKQTPLQAWEIDILHKAHDIDQACKQLKLGTRPGIPLEIIRAYESLHNPADLAIWGQTPRNKALHRLAVEANRGSFIGKQAGPWGTQYSAVVNFWFLAQPKYRQSRWIPHLEPLFHPQLYQAIKCYDPKLELDLDWLHQLRHRLLQRNNKSAQQIWNPRIQNSYNLTPLNWVVLLELWVCVPELQHKNHLLELLGHRSLGPAPLFETITESYHDIT